MKKKWGWMIGGVFMGLLVGALVFAGLVQAAPDGAPLLVQVGTAFTYQGYITDTGNPANGSYNLAFKLYDEVSAGTQVGSTVTKNAVTVLDGYFTVELDFGDEFDGTALWLQIEVQGPGDPGFTVLSPRQPLSPTPYAINADMLDGLDSSDLYTQAEVDALLDGYDARITALEGLLASVSIENGGQEFVFTGVNVHVRSGSGATSATINGLGNLIVGYNEARGSGSDKSGSHNLVVGDRHNYTNYGGFVAGSENTVSGIYSSVLGGRYNTASSDRSSVSGGEANIASGSLSSVSGGYGNTASGYYSSVSGGYGNEASHSFSSVSGGAGNTATGITSSVSGGNGNTASGYYSSVSGGYGNTASGNYSSVSGGNNRSVSGSYDWRAGGLFEGF